MSKKAKICLGFLGMLVLLPLQAVFSEVVYEPYPAVMMPGFGGYAQSNETVAVRNVEVTLSLAGERRRRVGLRELFPNIIEPRVMMLLENTFPVESEAASKPGTPRTTGWSPRAVARDVRDRVVAVIDSWRPSPGTAEESEEIREWLSAAATRATGEMPERMTVRWLDRIYDRKSWKLLRVEGVAERQVEFSPGMVGE